MPETPRNPNRYFVMAGWNDAPHLTEEMKSKMAGSIEPHLREARMTGNPSMGSGLIFPILDDDIVWPDFQIPDYYQRCFGMDTGWKYTAGVWLARNNDTGVSYLYDCYKGSEEKPPVHAQAFKDRGEWIPGAGDCAEINRMDGTQFLAMYRGLGLDVMLPDKRSKEANIQEVWLALSTGKLKIFRSCVKWFEEKRLYRRDIKGQVVKANDHLMDATQYAVKSGLPMAVKRPVPAQVFEPPSRTIGDRGGFEWMR